MKAAAVAAAVVLGLTPTSIGFGDLVTATVRGGGVPDFAPFAVRGHHGSTYQLQCLDPACVPGPEVRVVSVQHRPVRILPRATQAEIQQPLRSFRRETAVRPTSYRVSPALLRPLLFAGAALLLLLALVLAAPVLRRLVPERRDERTPLERALDFVRDSLRRDGADRRRALDLLGRALENDPRSQEAFDLAWSRSDPDPAQAERLTERLAPNR
jgi:hypothetical protein